MANTFDIWRHRPEEYDLDSDSDADKEDDDDDDEDDVMTDLKNITHPGNNPLLIGSMLDRLDLSTSSTKVSTSATRSLSVRRSANLFTAKSLVPRR